MAKIPPPPDIAAKDPVLNRWLIELTATLNGQGDIDPGSIAGFLELQNEVAQNTADIAALKTSTTALTAEINTLSFQINILTSRSVVLNGAGAPAGGLGNNGDWYADTTNKHIYVKTGGAWLQIV